MSFVFFVTLWFKYFTTKKLGSEPQRDKGHKGFSQRK